MAHHRGGRAGLRFLALVIGYLPIFYQSYSRREIRISLLDARAGSPPSAVEMLVRQGGDAGRLESELARWEVWAAELLQNQLAYPKLAYFRSQHPNQSWLATLVTVLDASALVMLGAEGNLKRQGQLTFAMGRHVLADFVTVFRARRVGLPDRLSGAEEFAGLRKAIQRGSTAIQPQRVERRRLEELRAMYEPYADSLSAYFLIAIPSWTRDLPLADNWQASSWRSTGGRLTVSDPFRYA
ncbi:MAG: hypothetical protein ACRD3D_11675 [Terriglobia bacterium]